MAGVVRPWLVVAFVVACFLAFGSEADAATPPGPGWELVPPGVVVRPPAEDEMWQAWMWMRYTCTDDMSGMPQPFGVGEGINEFPVFAECYDPGTDSMIADPGQEVYVRKTFVSLTPPGEQSGIAGLTAPEVVDLCWMVILCWAGAYTVRLVAQAARVTES